MNRVIAFAFATIAFSIGQPRDLELNEKQTWHLNRVKNTPTTVDTFIVKVHGIENVRYHATNDVKKGTANETVHSDPPMVIHLSPTKKILISKYRLDEIYGQVVVTWTEDGTISVPKDDRKSKGKLTIGPKDDVVGLFYVGNTVYSIESLSGGLNVIVQLEQAKIRDEK
jgi:hypothetical protein